MESLDQCRRLQVREKASNDVFCDEPTSVWPQGVTKHRIFIKFFSISLGFLEFKEFNITTIPFALDGYETGYSQLGATRLWLFTISYQTRAHAIIVNER